jgi:hypothetical protein
VKRLGEPGPGEVHQAKWHGDVAVKVWTIDNPSEEMLRAFRREVCRRAGPMTWWLSMVSRRSKQQEAFAVHSRHTVHVFQSGYFI